MCKQDLSNSSLLAAEISGNIGPASSQKQSHIQNEIKTNDYKLRAKQENKLTKEGGNNVINNT